MANSIFLNIFGGVSSFVNINVSGQGLFADGSNAAPSISFTNQPTVGFSHSTDQINFVAAGTTDIIFQVGGNLYLRKDTSQLFMGVLFDVVLSRDAANVLALKNGSNPQAFKVFSNATDFSVLYGIGVLSLGGVTASFPRLLRTGVSVQLELADGSALTSLIALNVTLGGFIDTPAYKVGGVAGASKVAGPVTSITVVNGIVTAIS